MKTDKEKTFDMKVSSEKEETSEGEDIDTKLCEMEYIVDAKVVKDGTCKYLVKWKSYSEDDGTWELIENTDSRETIDEFWKTKNKKASNRTQDDRKSDKNDCPKRAKEE